MLTAITCVFLTGFASLVYEICWIRKASLVFGGTTWAVSAVFAIFFLGLATGSFVAGKFSPRIARPLRVCGWLETWVGIVAILSPTLFTWVDLLFGTFYSRVVHSMPLLALTRVALATVVVFPAAALMGGSLPLFCQQFVRHGQRLLRGVGVLYACNTLGAVAGTIACGFWIIPNAGVNVSIYIAGAINLCVALVVFRLAKVVTTGTVESESLETRVPSDGARSLPRRHSSTVLAILFFGVGFVGLANEVLWTRFLSLWMPNTVYTYTMTLATVLAGIVLGSLLAAAVGDRLRWKAGLFGAAQIVGGLVVMAIMQLRPTWWGSLLDPVSIAAQLSVIGLVMLVPAVLSGISFPLAVGLVVDDVSRTGSGVGKMLAFNMAGGVIGSLLVGFLTLPLLGMQFTLFFTTGLSLLIGVIAWCTLAVGFHGSGRIAGIALAIMAWAAIPWLCQTWLPRDYLALEGELVDYREGIGNDVAIVRKGDDLWLEINRMWQGQRRKNHQVMAAHIPALLHGDPKSVLVIGLGSGQTARSFLVHDITRLDCVEIEDGLVDLVKHYYDSVWLDDPRVHLIIEDGRDYITHIRDRYDLISIEVGQIYRPGVASFYTVDFYQRLRSRLNTGGVVCQFLPVEFFSPDEFRTMVATFHHVFPQCVLWYNTSELLLIGSKQRPLTFSWRALTPLIATNARLKKDLDFAYWGGKPYYLSQPVVLLAGFLCGPRQLAELSTGSDLYRDDRPYLEYVGLWGRPGADDIVTLIRTHLAPLTDVVASMDKERIMRGLEIREQNLREIIAHAAVDRGKALQSAGRPREALAAYRAALRTMPIHPVANYQAATILQAQGDVRGAVAHYRQVLVAAPNDFRALRGLAIATASAGRTKEAERLFRQALARRPDDMESSSYLASLLQSNGNLAEAARVYQRLLARDPNSTEAHVDLARILLAMQEPDRAIRQFQEALRQNPQAAAVHAGLGAALAMAGRLEEAASSFAKALQLQPDLVQAQLGIANILFSKGQFDQAAEAFHKTLTLAPNLVEAHVGMAYALQSSGQLDSALAQLRAALQLAPKDVTALTAAAWILATHHEPTKREPAQALRWAKQAWRLTGQASPLVADVLAAAYAANGQFDQAVQLARQALRLAETRKMPQLADEVRKRLALYRANKPFVQ